MEQTDGIEMGPTKFLDEEVELDGGKEGRAATSPAKKDSDFASAPALVLAGEQ